MNPKLTTLVLVTLMAGCGSRAQPIPPDTRAADAGGGAADASGSDSGLDADPMRVPDAAPLDLAPAPDAATDTAADVAAALLGRLEEAKVLDDRICDAVWARGRWVAGVHRGELGPNAISLRAIDLEGRLLEVADVARDVSPEHLRLATDGERVAVAWLKVGPGYAVWFALVGELAGPPGGAEIARASDPPIRNHTPVVATAWNGSSFAVLHGDQTRSELVLLTPAGQISRRLAAAPVRYPGMFGRLLVGTREGFAFLESCPDRPCLRVRRIASQDGSDRGGFDVVHGDALSTDGNTIAAALAYDPTRDEVWGALAADQVLQFDGRGQTLLLADTTAGDSPHRGRSVDAAFLDGGGRPLFHVAWTAGSRTFHRDAAGQVGASEVRDLFSGGIGNGLTLASAPGAIGLFSSRNATCRSCDPPPASAWYARLPRP